VDSSNHNNSTLLDSIIADILDDMPLAERVSIAHLNEAELRMLQLVMGKYMKYRLEQLFGQGNNELLNECREKSGNKSLDDSGASEYILEMIWKRLRETHKIRVVK
jgi:hypothetical protein